MIDINHVSQIFTSPHGTEVRAVDDVSLHINKGEIFGIIGRSGAGKSTLVRTINFLNKPSSGTVTVNGKCLNKLNDGELRQMRTKIGMIFQHFNLLSSRTVFDNIALPLELCHTPKAEIKTTVTKLIDLVGLNEHWDKYPAQLSGGQKQRVGIARALANNPMVLLSDEATSALDPETTRSTLALLEKINYELGVTIVLITHEMDVVKQICSRVVVLDKGKIVEQGSVIDVFRHPKHPTTKALLADVVVHDMPECIKESVAQRIKTVREQGRFTRLLRLTYVGSEVTAPFLSEFSKSYFIDFNILQAQVEELKGTSFGMLIILAECENAAQLEAGLIFLKSNNIDYEEISL